MQVEIREHEPTGLELFQRIAVTALPPLATAGIVLLFVVFILYQREDLRDRLIRLFGGSDLQRATATLNDAATRLSRYFLSLTAINFSLGAVITLALWLIGIPSPIVWGVLAALMRFVPFIGPYIAAAFPVLLAAVVDPGWSTVLLTAALLSGDRTDHGPSGRAACVRARHGHHAARGDCLHRILDLAVGAVLRACSLPCPSPSSSPCSGGMWKACNFSRFC